ncbi:lipoyl(octanoyl) transferase LipB [Galactobacter valiniphilus]|uniref:lipoyl(octanoyl) transferase LipB n=1 Tax=Galactobacter valiniphilus TaxID=2676122 RepID=UPI0037352167
MATHVTPALLEPGYAPEPVPYLEAWALQRRLHDGLVEDAGDPGYLIALEHASVYTAGRRTQPSDHPTDGTPVIAVDRGGLLTWHGPGQLVVYPIVRLRDPGAVKDYVDRLEQALIDTLTGLGIEATRVDGRAGVWIRRAGQRDAKIAAIGIHIEDGVTMHGLALNVNCALDAYEAIVPCGITDAGVTTVAEQLGHDLTPAQVAPTLIARLGELLAPALAIAARQEVSV